MNRSLYLYLLGCLLIAPLTGFLIGGLVSIIGFRATPFLPGFVFAFFYGALPGGLTGLIFGIPTAGALIDADYKKAIRQLCLGTIIPAFPLSFFFGVYYGWFGGMLGYWIAFFLFKFKVAKGK